MTRTINYSSGSLANGLALHSVLQTDGTGDLASGIGKNELPSLKESRRPLPGKAQSKISLALTKVAVNIRNPVFFNFSQLKDMKNLLPANQNLHNFKQGIYKREKKSDTDRDARYYA